MRSQRKWQKLECCKEILDLIHILRPHMGPTAIQPRRLRWLTPTDQKATSSTIKIINAPKLCPVKRRHQASKYSKKKV